MAGLSVERAALGYGTLGSVSSRVIPTAVDHSDQGDIDDAGQIGHKGGTLTVE